MSEFVVSSCVVSPPVYPSGGVFRDNEAGRGDGPMYEALVGSYYRAYEAYARACIWGGCKCKFSDEMGADDVGQRSVRSVGVQGVGELCEKVETIGASVSNSGSSLGLVDVGVEKEKERKNNVPGAFGNSCHEKGDQNVIGKNVERNRGWRKEKKERKQKKKENGKSFMEKENWRDDKSPFSLGELSRNQDIELRNSLAAKWKAENALAKLRAERQLAILNSSDVQDEVKQHRTKLNATIERNMVSIEKTHATLRATGNVAGEFHGSAETVMTPGLSSGTISPDSSASMQEFRAVQKRNLDLENKIKIATEKLGVDIEHIDLYDKEIWTNNSVNEAILDKMYPDGYGMDGTFYDEGKVRVIPT